MSHPHTSGILAAQRPRCGEKARKNARWNFVDLNVLEIPGNPEILDKNFRKSENLCQICTRSRNPGQFFLGFPKSGKSRTLFWVVKCPSKKPLYFSPGSKRLERDTKCSGLIGAISAFNCLYIYLSLFVRSS